MSLSDAVDSHDPVARLRSFIQNGGYTEGVRLPPERHLTDELGMTRATLRKAPLSPMATRNARRGLRLNWVAS